MRSWSDYKQTASQEEEIFDAVRAGETEKLVFYVFNNGDVNLTNHKGHSLLMLAAYNGHEAMTELLIQHGADVNSRDNSGNTILMGVSFKGHLSIAKKLLAAGAESHVQNPQGQDALMFAEAFGRHEMAQLLRDNQTAESMRPHSPRALRQASAIYRIIQSSLFRSKGA